MSWRGVCIKVFWLWAVSTHLFGFAQEQGKRSAFSGTGTTGEAQTIEAALHQMSDRAAVVFIGTVADVHRIEDQGLVVGTVEIRFDVEQPLRGCSTGAYVLREWAGFWNANDARYRVGQRLLLFLHAPGAAGLSSPVGGMDGAIPLRASGSGVRLSETDKASSAEQVADLRWIGARVRRTVSYKNTHTEAVARTRASITVPAEPTESPMAASNSSVAAQEASVATVIGMIRSWEVASHATR